MARRDGHPGYRAAKSGDAGAALDLARDLIDNDAVDALFRLLAGRPVTVLPVVADELTGFNAIPDAMAQSLGNRFGLPVQSGEIVQSNKVGHTRAPSFQRIVTPAQFDGPVRTGAYVIVDDHVGLGGTIASLRGHVEAGGGVVVAITTLTESRDAHRIALRATTSDMLWRLHGNDLELLWQKHFGYGIECLTELEAQQLCRQPTVAAIEDFLAKAAIEARGRGLAAAVGDEINLR